MFIVQLSDETEKRLLDFCQQQGLTESQVVEEGLKTYFKQAQNNLSPYELGKDLFGREGSQNPNSSANYKQILKDKLNKEA